MEITKEFTFEAAHFLPHVPPGHKCGRMHGHSYKLRVTIAGELNDEGWVCDFADISWAVRPIVDSSLDHHLLNDILDNPTSELLCEWLWRQIEPRIDGLAAIAISETCSSACELRQPQATGQPAAAVLHRSSAV